MSQRPADVRQALRSVQAWGSYGTHQLRWRLGPLGLTGLALALAATLLTAASQFYWKPQALQTEASLALLERQRMQRAATPSADSLRANWVTQLPQLDTTPELMASLHREATRAGIRIERAEYRPPSAEQSLRRMQVVLPVQGGYSGIKRWLARVMQAHPYCAVDELSFVRRDGPAAASPQSELQARIVLSFYLKALP
jgi:Type II secretion system (T2SS), protein M subtype b